jgi:hypothetical protein
MNGNAWAAIGVLIGTGLLTDIGILLMFLPIFCRIDRIDRMTEGQP